MISEKHIQRVNNVIKDMVFDYDDETLFDVKCHFEFQIAITGQKRMMSVGEYYDYLNILVEIIDGDKRTTQIFHVMSNILNNNIEKQYKVRYPLNQIIREELEYFFYETDVKVNIVKIQFSEEYQEKINNVDTSNIE